MSLRRYTFGISVSRRELQGIDTAHPYPPQMWIRRSMTRRGRANPAVNCHPQPLFRSPTLRTNRRTARLHEAAHVQPDGVPFILVTRRTIAMVFDIVMIQNMSVINFVACDGLSPVREPKPRFHVPSLQPPSTPSSLASSHASSQPVTWTPFDT